MPFPANNQIFVGNGMNWRHMKMQVNNITSPHINYQSKKIEKQVSDIYLNEFSGAVAKNEEGESEGKFLGLTMLPEEGKSVVYGMRAMLSDKSTPNKPIVQVISNLDGKKEVFDVDISKIDPQNASRIEMFALCSYEDKYGIGTGSTFGSFHTFRMYEETAKQNGCIKQINEGVSAWEQFRNEKVNWVSTCEFVLDILQTFKEPNVIDLFLKGKKLLNVYSKYIDLEGAN